MARPEPNIFSQKCGKACEGAFASAMITSGLESRAFFADKLLVNMMRSKAR
jgi:hypothetical protein